MVWSRPESKISVFDYGAVGDGLADDTDAVQAFFDYAVSHACERAVIYGSFLVSSTIVIDGTLRGIQSRTKTRIFEFNAKFLAVRLSPGDVAPYEPPTTVLEIRNMQETSFLGQISIDGYVERRDGVVSRRPDYAEPGTAFASYSSNELGYRKTDFGIRILNSSRSHFEQIRVDHVRIFGVDIQGDIGTNNSLLSIDSIIARYCGPSNHPGGAMHHAEYDLRLDHLPPGRVDTDGDGEPDSVSRYQSSVVRTTSQPPEEGKRGALVLINDEFYYAYGYNEHGVARSVSVHPWVPTDLPRFPSAADPGTEVGRLTYFYGGAVRVVGNDVSLVNIDLIDAIHCGIALHDMAHYGPIVKRLVAQYCGIGYVCGGRPGGARQGTTINGLYVEACLYAIVDSVNGLNSGPNIVTKYALNWSDCQTLAPQRTVPLLESGKQRIGFRNFNILSNGRLLQGNKGRSFHEEHAHVLRARWTGQFLGADLTYQKDSWTIVLPPEGHPTSSARFEAEFISEHRLWGQDSVRFTFIGSRDSGIPTGPFVFESWNPAWELIGPPPSVHAATLRFDVDNYEFMGPIVFTVHYRFDTKNIIVTPVAGLHPIAA